LLPSKCTFFKKKYQNADNEREKFTFFLFPLLAKIAFLPIRRQKTANYFAFWKIFFYFWKDFGRISAPLKAIFRLQFW